MASIAEGLRADVRDLFDSEGNHRMSKSLTKPQASQIAGYEIILKNAEAGDGHIDRVLKVKLDGSGGSSRQRAGTDTRWCSETEQVMLQSDRIGTHARLSWASGFALVIVMGVLPAHAQAQTLFVSSVQQDTSTMCS